ncbi:MAG TPA: type II toxin-antitoxin system HicA family toxin [Thermoanaerobaculia bacterium]|nr:type II toxin-antitoxin system HicA family toxin [Thermoanaerobaculia bacterium]
MTKVPPLKPLEVMAILRRFGFEQVRQRGSHRQFRHQNGRVTTVPDHRGRDISPILIRRIADEIGVPIEDFLSKR